jgi:hypothetical protein
MIQQVNDALLNTLGDAPDVPRVLVGSMKDLAHQRQVSMQVRLIISIQYHPQQHEQPLQNSLRRTTELTLYFTHNRTHRHWPIRGVSLTLSARAKRVKTWQTSFIQFSRKSKKMTASWQNQKRTVVQFCKYCMLRNIYIYQFSGMASSRGATCS